jgi:hypothetical protein
MMSWSPMSLRTMRIVCGSPLSIRRRKDCTRYECPLWHPRKACHKPHPHFHPSRDRSSLRWRSGRAKICHRSYQILRKIDSPLSSSFAISRLGCISTTPVQSSANKHQSPHSPRLYSREFIPHRWPREISHVLSIFLLNEAHLFQHLRCIGIYGSRSF